MNALKSIGRLTALVLFVLMFSLAMMQACKNDKAQAPSTKSKANTPKVAPRVTPKVTPKTTAKTQPVKVDSKTEKKTPKPAIKKPLRVMPATKSGIFLHRKPTPKLLPATKKGPFLKLKPKPKAQQQAPNQLNAPNIK